MFECGSDLFVWAGCGRSQMPGSPLVVMRDGDQRLRKRCVRGPALGGCCGVVDGRSDERMPKSASTILEAQKLDVLGRFQRGKVKSETGQRCGGQIEFIGVVRRGDD